MKNECLPFYLAASLALATGPALADNHENCPLTYETFEYSVPRIPIWRNAQSPWTVTGLSVVWPLLLKLQRSSCFLRRQAASLHPRLSTKINL